MLFELREEQVKYFSTGVTEVTERRIATRNEIEIDSRFANMEVGHRRNLKVIDGVIHSIVRTE
jgi:hypothetical protein